MTTDMRHAELEVVPDSEAVAMRMAELLIERVTSKEEGIFRVALSGGSTPKRLFEILARPGMSERVDWSRVEIFYGDERHVPAGHKDSNHTTASTILLSHVPIPQRNVHPIPTTSTVRDDARLYQKTLATSYGAAALEPGRPLFDLVMLGMGADGHTASLFPGQPVLQENEAWVGTSVPADAPYERLTLTYPAIASSRLVVFLITGASKTPMLKRLREGDKTIPSGRITSEGRILILADREAAGEEA